MNDFTALLELFSPILLNIAAWWRFCYRPHDSRFSRRRAVSLAGLLFNSAAIVMCWAGLVVSLSLDVSIIATLTLSTLAVICGFFCLGTMRLLIIVTGILTAGFWFWMAPHIGFL